MNPRRRFTVGEQMAKGLAQAVEVGECLEWQGSFSCSGVTPVVKVKPVGKRYSDNVAVNRELWEAAYGPIPDGLMIYRTCCNNACICLDHLTIGTRKQWMRHRKKAGLTRHTEATRLKITAAARTRDGTVNNMEKAREVRSLRGQMTREEIARVTGVSLGMVADILDGTAWKETVSSPFAGLFAANDSKKRAA